MVGYPKRTIYRRRFWIKARNIPNDFKLRPLVRENLNKFSWFIYTDIYTVQDGRVILIRRRAFVTPELWRVVVILENGANPNRRTERNSRSPDKCTWTWWSAFRVQSIERRHKRATIVLWLRLSRSMRFRSIEPKKPSCQLSVWRIETLCAGCRIAC